MFAYCSVALLLLGSMLGSELVPALLPLLSLSSIHDLLDLLVEPSELEIREEIYGGGA